MSTRAMAKHYASLSGGGGMPQFQSDIFGDKERRSNRMADADLQRQLLLMKLAEELDRETSKQKGEQDTSNKKSEYSHQKSVDSLISQGIISSKEAFNGLPQTVQDHLVKQQNNKAETLSTNSEIDKNFASSDMGKKTREFGQAGLNTMPGMNAIKEGTTTLRENETARIPNPWDLTTFGAGSGMSGNKQSTEFKEVFNPQTMKMEMKPSGVSTTTMTPGKFPIGKIDLSAELGLPSAPAQLNTMPDVPPPQSFPTIMDNNQSYDLQGLRNSLTAPPTAAATLNPAPSGPPSMTAFGTPSINNPEFLVQKLQALDKLLKMIPSNANPGY